MSKPKFTKDDRRTFYAMRQYSFLLIMRDLARAIQGAKPQLDERTGNLLEACWMALSRTVPTSYAAEKEARKRYNDGQRYPYHPVWLETRQETLERRRREWREEQASKPEEAPREQPQTGRNRPRRQAYREWFKGLSEEEQRKQNDLLSLFVAFLLGSVPCQAEEPAEQPEDDDDGNDLDPDVWGDLELGDD